MALASCWPFSPHFLIHRERRSCWNEACGSSTVASGTFSGGLAAHRDNSFGTTSTLLHSFKPAATPNHLLCASDHYGLGDASVCVRWLPTTFSFPRMLKTGSKASETQRSAGSYWHLFPRGCGQKLSAPERITKVTKPLDAPSSSHAEPEFPYPHVSETLRIPYNSAHTCRSVIRNSRIWKGRS